MVVAFFLNALFCCIQAEIKKKNKMEICILKKLNSKNGSWSKAHNVM